MFSTSKVSMSEMYYLYNNVMFASNLFWELSSSENIYCTSTLADFPLSLSQLQYSHLFAKFEHCLIQFLRWCAPLYTCSVHVYITQFILSAQCTEPEFSVPLIFGKLRKHACLKKKNILIKGNLIKIYVGDY